MFACCLNRPFEEFSPAALTVQDGPSDHPAALGITEHAAYSCVRCDVIPNRVEDSVRNLLAAYGRDRSAGNLKAGLKGRGFSRAVPNSFLIVILRPASFASRRTYGLVGTAAAAGQVHRSFVGSRRRSRRLPCLRMTGGNRWDARAAPTFRIERERACPEANAERMGTHIRSAGLRAGLPGLDAL
jgi:hypothetical protein